MLFRHQILQFLKRHHYTRIVPRAALIDMDGTLYDSMPSHAAAWHRLVTELGFNSRPEDYYLWEGRTGADVIDTLMMRERCRHATDEEKATLYHRKTQYFKELPQAQIMPGALEMLSVLRQAHVRTVLVTGSSQGSLLERLDLDFPGVFPNTLRVRGHDVTHGKPHPEPFLRGMQLAHVSPSQALAIDNAPLGVEAGDRAGAFTIGVVTGPIPAEALAEAGAAVVFSSMRECADQMPLLLFDLLRTSRPL